MFEDPLFWILVLPGLLLGVYAQSRIKINIAKYSQVRTKDGITGAQVARLLLDSQGLRNVAIESSPGMLSDHYDPRSKTLRLSQEIYFAPSIAAAGIAAHEAGHALQDAVGYFPLEARTSIVPQCNWLRRQLPGCLSQARYYSIRPLPGSVLFSLGRLRCFL